LSLLFNANDEVAVATGEADDTDTGTMLIWLYPMDVGVGGKVYLEKYVGGEGKRLRLNTNIEFLLDRDTTDLSIIASPANMSTFGADKWCCLAAVYDAAGANGDQKLYHGDINTDFVEAAAYGTQAVGSGDVVTDAGSDTQVGNTGATDPADEPAEARIAIAAWWSEELTLAELIEQQYSLSNTRAKAATVFFVALFPTPEERSGQSVTWVVTGATGSPWVPLNNSRPTLLGPEIEAGDVEIGGRDGGPSNAWGGSHIGIALDV